MARRKKDVYEEMQQQKAENDVKPCSEGYTEFGFVDKKTGEEVPVELIGRKKSTWSRSNPNKELDADAAKALERGVSYGNWKMGNVYKAFNPDFDYPPKGYECHQMQTCLGW